MTPAVTAAERRARLARRHHLHPEHRAASIDEATADMVALHATDPASVYLGLLARVGDLSVAEVDHALYEERSLVRVLAMRRTIFATRDADVAIPFAACSRRIAATQRARLVRSLAASTELADPEAWLERTMAEALAALAELGPCPANDVTRAVPALRTRFNPAPGTKWGAEGPVGSRILSQLSMEGLIERDRPTGASFNSTRFRWRVLDPPMPDRAAHLDDDEARAILLRRWLERFGPGTEADLVWWSGLTKTAVRRAVAEIDAEAVDLDGTPGWRIPADDGDAGDPGPWVALVPGLDPTSMGWRDRSWYLDPEVVPHLFDTAGNAGPAVWADGRIVGAWAQRPDLEIVHELVVDISDDHRDLLALEVARVVEFLAGTAVPLRHRFPTPAEQRLTGA